MWSQYLLTEVKILAITGSWLFIIDIGLQVQQSLMNNHHYNNLGVAYCVITMSPAILSIYVRLTMVWHVYNLLQNIMNVTVLVFLLINLKLWECSVESLYSCSAQPTVSCSYQTSSHSISISCIYKYITIFSF